MNGPLNADNLDVRANGYGEVVIEPGYLSFIRDNGYPVDEILEAHTVKRKDSDTAHLVVKIETLEKPTNHPESDVVNDTMTLWVCDCWSWRGSSADASEGIPLTECGTCPHVEAVDKSIKAANDDQQVTL